MIPNICHYNRCMNIIPEDHKGFCMKHREFESKFEVVKDTDDINEIIQLNRKVQIKISKVYDLKKNEIKLPSNIPKEFKSSADAAKFFNQSRGNICSHLNQRKPNYIIYKKYPNMKFIFEKINIYYIEPYMIPVLIEGKKQWKCTFNSCGKIMKKKPDLRNHVRRHTRKSPFKCDYKGCNKHYPRKIELDEHKKTHTGEKPFICPFENCGERFLRESTLVNHIRIHTGEKPFKCLFENCGKSFRTQGNLIDHKRLHTGEKPFICSICGSHFRQSGALKSHIRTHTGEKPFKCPFENCIYTSTTGSSLREHILSHGPKTFKCPYKNCLYSGHLQKSLTLHINTSHLGIFKYRCNIGNCDYKTQNLREYNKHILNNHQNLEGQRIYIKKKQRVFVDELKKRLESKQIPNIFFLKEELFMPMKSCGVAKVSSTKRFMDTLLLYNDGKTVAIIWIEIDELQHKQYECPDNDLQRTSEIITYLKTIEKSQYANLPIILLRYCPDTNRINGRPTYTTKKYKFETFWKYLSQLKFDKSSPPFQMTYMFYDTEYKNNTHTLNFIKDIKHKENLRLLNNIKDIIV